MDYCKYKETVYIGNLFNSCILMCVLQFYYDFIIIEIILCVKGA